MTPTSPPSVSTTTSRPPAPTRNKSSSALSTQTLRSLSSTSASSGKPRRNKSSSSLAAHGHHSAGHHPVSFAHHRKGSHGPGHGHAAPGMKRTSSTGSTSGSQRKMGGFGLGMMSMTAADGSAAHDVTEEHGNSSGGDERGTAEYPARPDLGRRTSSSSTVTMVAAPATGERGRGSERSRSRSRARRNREEEDRAREREERERREEQHTPPRPQREKEVPSSATSAASSTSEWQSETDSPLSIGRKLPPVSYGAAEEQQLQGGKSSLALALDERGGNALNGNANGANGGGHRGKKKAKFSLGAAEELEEEEEDENEVAVEEEGEEEVPAIPAAAMPPSETAVLPAMPAVVEALAPSPPPGGAEKEKAEPSPEEIAAAGETALPPPPCSPQRLSPVDPSQAPAPMLEHRSGEEGGQQEPSLASAAQSEMAFPAGPPPSNPPSRSRSRPPSPIPSPPQPTASHPTRAASPIRPTPQHPPESSHHHQPSHPSSSGKPRPQAQRKTSDASIMSRASAATSRSHLTAGRAPPAFRRTPSGAAPVMVDRQAARAELASPRPDEDGLGFEEQQRRSIVGHPERGGVHSRTESRSSMRSLRAASEATAHPMQAGRRSNTLGVADARRLRASETAGGALAALGNIAALSHVSSARATPAPRRQEEEGALTHAKRSASGIFNRFLGSTSLSSTPPLSPSALHSGSRAPPMGGSHERGASYSHSRARTRSSPGPMGPPLVVKFKEPPPPSAPSHPPGASSESGAPLSTSPSAASHTQGKLSAQNRTSSSLSLSGGGAMSRTQQKALLARDAPPSSAPSPSPAQSQGQQNGMQKWAFGLIKEAERIERVYGASCERWRDPMGEALQRVPNRERDAGREALDAEREERRGVRRALTAA
ncbi:hypothetical protein JCM10213_005033 [Rhodosporidiobolus nylandii]